MKSKILFFSVFTLKVSPVGENGRYVLQSRGNQSEVEHVTFSVFYLIEMLIWRGIFCWKPHLNWISGSKVMSNWRILKTIENKRNPFLFLVISHNQCSRLQTDSTRSQHIYGCSSASLYRLWLIPSAIDGWVLKSH